MNKGDFVELDKIKLQIDKEISKTLKEVIGNNKYLIIFFYPKDLTPACTMQACSFRDLKEEFKNLNAEVIGISRDKKRMHDKFKKIFSLNFELFSDPTLEIHNIFGVYGEKKLFGKTIQGTLRSAFVLNNEGEILNSWINIDASDSANIVFKFLKESSKILAT